MAIASSGVQRRLPPVVLLGIHVGALRDKVFEAIELAIAGRVHEGRGAGPTPATTPRLGINVYPLPQEAGEGGEVALLRRLEKVLLLPRADEVGLDLHLFEDRSERTKLVLDKDVVDLETASEGQDG